MDYSSIREILAQVASGKRGPDDALQELVAYTSLRISEVNLDTGREHRTGAPEVIYAEGKELDALAELVRHTQEKGSSLLMTRLQKQQHDALVEMKLDADEYHPRSRIALWRGDTQKDNLPGKLVILTAGTSDLAVAEEAYYTARFFGIDATLHNDVGVAGLHRLIDHLDELRHATCIIAVAGMEGALPSVVAGLVEAPVIAVPTSVGYGTAFGGITAMLSMLNSCAGGVGVVNIDNGFGGALLALKIIKRISFAKEENNRETE